ncbi:hypothetical protein ACHAWF_007630, partial [Thalassiosira exigua]
HTTPPPPLVSSTITADLICAAAALDARPFCCFSHPEIYQTNYAIVRSKMMEVEQPAEPGPARADRGATLTADASRLFRVYKTISAMLSKRGYMVSREMKEMTPVDFTQRFGEYPSREGLTILVEKADDETNQLFVFFPEDEKVGVKPIKILTDRMKDESVSNAILVLRGDITPFAKQAVLEMSDSFKIEHFKEAELLVDITEHTLVGSCDPAIFSFSSAFASSRLN